MDENARFALIRQDLERVISICDPGKVREWKPTDAQKAAYAQLLQRLLDHIDAIKRIQKQRVLREGRVEDPVSDSSLAFFREKVEPRVESLRRAYAMVDPDGAFLYELFEGFGSPSGAGGRVRDTFEVGVQRIYDLIDDNPDIEYGFLCSGQPKPDTLLSVFSNSIGV